MNNYVKSGFKYKTDGHKALFKVSRNNVDSLCQNSIEEQDSEASPAVTIKIVERSQSESNPGFLLSEKGLNELYKFDNGAEADMKTILEKISTQKKRDLAMLRHVKNTDKKFRKWFKGQNVPEF